jgi:diguanylate cyclase (GGDEF)-like protein/putative nucleotidyltransferase with HDIG domain
VRHLAQTAFATGVVAVSVAGGVWLADVAHGEQRSAARAARAAAIEHVIALARRERALVERHGRSKSHLPGIRRIAAIERSARVALARERSAALGEPSPWPLRRAGAVAALLAAVEGPLLLFGVFRRHRRRLDLRHQERFNALAAQARTDTLTRLGNRRAFEDDLGHAIARRTESGLGFALMAIDLDGLKRINDTNGHPAGDAHIQNVADCIKTVVKDVGSVYRTGGDEFMVILPGRRNWHGQNLAAKIDELTRAQTGGRAVSIGLTESLGHERRHLLINEVDVALYEAKRTRLSAVAFHPGLRRATPDVEDDRPSHEQRALAAALARAVDAKDAGTRSHSETVAQLCAAIGEQLGIDGAELERLRLAGLLHDVGKIGVADAILHKPETLAPDEHSAMAEHVETGHAILLAAELPTEAHWILHHHERVDGAGYPFGLAAGAIPIQSRIIAVADAFEAMTGSRPYREPISVDEALAELYEHADTQFDVRCVDALVEVVRHAATEEELVGITHGGPDPVPLAPRPRELAAALIR